MQSISFKEYVLKENFGDDHDFSTLTPFHKYFTKDGHEVAVHLFNDPKGKHAVFHNNSLGVVTKLVHWGHGETPSKDELENSGKEDLNEAFKSMTPDTAGKLAEHNAMIHMIGIKHAQNKTFGSKKHAEETAEHHAAVSSLSAGHDPKDVAVRAEHGKAMANAAHEAVKLKHGDNAKITKVGHTSKPGDIGRFTNGKHNDTQDNPSDLAVEVKAGGKVHHEGFSLKSSAKSNNITLKNPAIHMDGMLDHSTRKMKTEEVSRKEIAKVHKKMGLEGTNVERGRKIADVRKKEGVANGSSIEKEANKHGIAAKHAVSKELHDHLHHLTTIGDEGHHMIGKMLESHMTANTSMPWSKIHAQGHDVSKVKATVTSGSESPLRKVFKNKNTKYAVSRSGERVTVHRVEKDGSHTPLAHYSPKTKSNVAKESVHGWNVLGAASH